MLKIQLNPRLGRDIVLTYQWRYHYVTCPLGVGNFNAKGKMFSSVFWQYCKCHKNENRMSFLWKYLHWLHRNLRFWQFQMQSVTIEFVEMTPFRFRWSIHQYCVCTCLCTGFCNQHYNDVIMSAMASHITGLTIVYSIVYSGADQRKYQNSASLAFVRGIHRWPVNSPHKGPVTRKMSSWNQEDYCIFLVWVIYFSVIVNG